MEEVIAGIEAARNNVNLYETLFVEMESMLGGPLIAPRTAGQQTLRANPPAESAKEYYRMSYFLPYCEHLASDLRNRFESAPLVSKGKLF